MRGRLIQRFLADLRQLDTEATAAADVDGSGPQTGGYDPDLREPIYVDETGTGTGGVSSRREKASVMVPCQLDTGGDERLRQVGGGMAPESVLSLVFHFRDLERLGLVAANGKALVDAGDRLAGIYDLSGTLVQDVPNPPGLFVVRSKTSGWGLNMRRPQRNLLLVEFGERVQAAAVGE